MSSPVGRLRALAATAMIGADRASGDARSPEKLLSQAAVLGAQARAGYRARRFSGSVRECPPDPRPAAGHAATATLMRLLGDPDAGLIEEWAELAQARGRRAADHTVPVLLDWWCRQAQRKEAVFAVCGKRGEWLASLNPAWRKPVAGADIPVNADDIWQNGKTPERLAVLLTIRRHDPARALALIQSTWNTDGADERRRFVGVLSEKASMADEPFLEAALDDKSKIVRRAGAAVLGGIAGSRFSLRMYERAKAIIVVEAKRGVLKRGQKVTLHPPQEFDKSWERDGLEEQAAGGMGKRAWWMRQILSAAELSVWTEVTGLEPAGVLEAISGDDYFGVALESIVDVVKARGNAAWCRAVQGQLLAGKKLEPADIGGLWSNLGQEESQRLILEATEHKRWSGTERWAILASAEYRWSREFSGAALRLLAKSAPRKGEVWGLYEPVERLSRFLSPDLAEQYAETVLGMFPDEPTDSFKRSIDRIRLRAEMHKEFGT